MADRSLIKSLGLNKIMQGKELKQKKLIKKLNNKVNQLASPQARSSMTCAN
jgi:ribosomal protein L30/L7E